MKKVRIGKLGATVPLHRAREVMLAIHARLDAIERRILRAEDEIAFVNPGGAINGDRLMRLLAPVDRSPKGGDREDGRHAKHESAVGGEADEAPIGAGND